MSNWNACTSSWPITSIRVGDRSAERKDDATPQRFGDTARAFTEVARDGIGLFEVRMRGVQHERLPAAKLMGEDLLEASVPALRQPRSDVDPILFGWVVINIEVLGLQNTKIEFLVLTLFCPRY